MTEATLALPAVDGLTVHGWLAALGAARALSEHWPDMRMRWQEPTGAEAYAAAVYPVITGGPASLEEATEVILTTTVDSIPAGGVLPGLDPAYPPDGRDWSGPNHDHPQTVGWPGAAGALWQSCLITTTGVLHPLLRPHAAQTVRGMLAMPGQALAVDRGLMRAALVGLGLDDRYKGGLWILRHTVTAADAPTGQPGGRASAGRDWLAIMALPWMPVSDDCHPDYRLVPDAPGYRTTAVGWRWLRWRSHTGDHGWRQVMDWRCWPEDLPVGSVPATIGRPWSLPFPGVAGWRGVAHRPKRVSRYDPPFMRSYSRTEVAEHERLTRDLDWRGHRVR